MIVIDVETYSEANIKEVGGWRYCRDPSTELICLAWAVDDGDVQLWLPGQPEPFFPRGHQFAAHNSFFEWCVFEYVLGWHEVAGNPEDWVDTAALAAAVSLPRSLGEACKALGMPSDLSKSKRGQYLIQRLCKPQGKLQQRNRDPGLLAELHDYCRQDVVAERELLRRLPPLTPTERRVWQIDQRVNQRGVLIDRELVSAAMTLAGELTEIAEKETQQISGGAVSSMTERDSALELLAVHGCRLPDLTKQTVDEALLIAEPGSTAERLLQLRRAVSKTSTAKFRKLLDVSDVDGRAHGMLMYHGASTGRWAGRLVQFQNLPRPAFSDTDQLADQIKTRDASWLRTLYGDEMSALSSAIRSCIVAPKGKKLFVSDYSAIEARVCAWLAGEQGILDVFRTHGKLYEYTAAQIYKVPIAAVTPEQRQVGKVGALSMQFGGGSAAFMRMGKTYGVVVEEEEAEAVKKQWRAANKRIVALWYSMDDAAKGAIAEPGTVFTVGRLAFRYTNGKLWMKLPSGRRLVYHKARVDEEGQIVYLGNNPLTHNWGEIRTWGSRLCENATQSVARDILAEALLRVENEGFEVVLSIHDEIIAEADERRTSEEYDALLCVPPSWAGGLPLAAHGYCAPRYKKA